MRRRQRLGARHESMDATRWPLCDRFDGGEQPCICWFAERQTELMEAGEWPDAEVSVLTDYLELAQRHECNRPFDRSEI